MKIYKSIQTNFLNAYKEIRSERKSKFNFYPKNLSIKNISKLIFYEIVDKLKSDTFLISLVISDLQERGLLHKIDPIQKSFYKFKNFTFHDIYIKTSDNKVFSRGTSADIIESYAKALGEVFERTVSRFNLSEDSIIYSISKIKSENLNFVHPDNFARPTEKQIEKFPLFKIENSDNFAWINVKDFISNQNIYIPSQTVFLDLENNQEKEIIQRTTHGTGAAFSPFDSFLSAYFEIIHRHFFLKSWYRDDSVSRIVINSIPQDTEIFKIIKDVQDRDFEVEFLDFSVEAKIPTIICLIKKNGGIYCGGSTSKTMLGALNRSLQEAFSTFLWVCQASQRGENFITDKDILDLEKDFLDKSLDPKKRVMLYANSHFVKNLSLNILKIKKEQNYTKEFDTKKDFDYKAHSQEIFENIYFYDYKSEILEGYDYFVSKVIIPQSYFFALSEIFSRPILKDDLHIKNTLHNPFP